MGGCSPSPSVGYTRFLAFLSDVGPHFSTRQPRNTPQAGHYRRQQTVRSRLSWVRTALASRSPSGSPGVAFKEVCRSASELTPGLETLTAASFQSLLAPWQMPSMLDRGDAKEVLKDVVEKIMTRAEKRKHKAAIKRSAEGSAALEEQAKPAWQPRQGC